MTKFEEFRKGWPVLLAASLGAGVGVSSLLTYSAGLFYGDLSREIGLSRTGFGIIYFCATIAIAIAVPWVGKLIDSYGVKTPTVLGALGLAAAFVGLALLTTSVWTYAVLMILLGLLGAPSTSVGFTRAVASWFHAARGLALGITQAGIGISATLVPLLVAIVLRDHGWRAAYLALAAIAVAGVPTAFFLLKVRSDDLVRKDDTATDAEFSAVLRSRTFWLQAAAFTIVTLTFIGMVVHLVPMLEERGLSPLAAASYAGLIGFSVLASRLLVGWLADLVHAPWLGAFSCAVGAIGCLALAAGGASTLPFAAAAIGFAVGAEIDLLGYLTSRNFGLGVYGRAYAWQYAAVICASGASPVWVGWLADQFSYGVAAGVGAILSLVAMTLFLMLPRLPKRADRALTACA